MHAFHSELMKDLVLLMINVRMVFFVDTKIVQPQLAMIVVVEINSRVKIIQMNISLMMYKLGSYQLLLDQSLICNFIHLL